MDPMSRSKHASISDEDWAKLGYLPIQDPGLKTDIHPLFQHTKAQKLVGQLDPVHRHIWPQYTSPEEYNAMFGVLGPSLQLASNILESPDSLDYLYQVAHSPQRVSPSGILSNQGLQCKEFGRAATMSTAITRAWVKNTLRNLANSLRFRMENPNANANIRGSIAVTNFSFDGFMDGVKVNDVGGKSGVASVITINETYIRMLKHLDNQAGDFSSQKMSLQLRIAITLCHEVAHALAFAVNGELLGRARTALNDYNQAASQNRPYQWPSLATYEPFYQDETMAEIGNSWENHVFDGKIVWSGDSASDPLFVVRWPSFLTSDDPYPSRNREKTTARKYLVSEHYIRNLHRQEFWDTMKSQPEPVNPLYIKKTVGIAYSNPDPAAQSPNPCAIIWPADDNSSRVDRERGGQPRPDPSSCHANETAHHRYARENLEPERSPRP